MFLKKQIIGRRGEDIAADHLGRQGFQIIDRNYRKPWGELDLIVQKGNDLRFVEVKTVTRETITPPSPLLGQEGEEDYEPEDNIHPWKRKRLRRIIETYILAKDLDDEIDWQVDAISVYLNPTGDLLKIEWLEDIEI